MIRYGEYCRYMGKTFKCGSAFTGDAKLRPIELHSNDIDDIEERGFEENPLYNNTNGKSFLNRISKYIKKVFIDDIEWICHIRTDGYYKGCSVWVCEEKEDTYSVIADYDPSTRDLFTPANGFVRIDKGEFLGNVPKNEITNIYEIKTPIRRLGKEPKNWELV